MSKILLVDDEKDIVRIVKNGLQKKGFEVDAFDNPKEALLKFTRNTYDLILLDVRMPEMNGYELYEELKNIDPNAKIHFLTAFEFLQDTPKRIVSDMIGKNFIHKPITIEKLVDLINTRIHGM